ncbi:hypothetical protein HS327_02123 [Glaesserella parasuis]|nr:hypothetical protein HS327_02123 [Glaesserella parasuis]
MRPQVDLLDGEQVALVKDFIRSMIDGLVALNSVRLEVDAGTVLI